MIVRYEARFPEDSKPKICKVVASDDETSEVETVLTLSNTEELPAIDDDIVWQHMANLVEYIKIAVDSLELVARGFSPDEGWPVLGWPTIFKLNEEVTSWWAYLTYREEKVEVIHNLGV